MTGPACDRIKPFLAMPCAAFAILAASLGALAFAFILQYGFDVQPCILCLWQRVPFGLAAALCAAALIVRPYGPHTRVLIALCAVAFLANTGLAVFHTGVERHWWEGTRGCRVTPALDATLQDLKAKIMNTKPARCDEISWTFLGLSMANWNVPFSLALALFAFAAAACLGGKKA